MAKVMTATLTPKRRALLDAMRAAEATGAWVRVPQHGYCIRWDRELPFPDHMRTWPGRHGDRPYARWGDTYTQHVFVHMATARGAILVRECRAPWVEARDRDATLTLAHAILNDPAAYLDRWKPSTHS